MVFSHLKPMLMLAAIAGWLAAAAQVQVDVIYPAGEVPQFSKIELGLTLPREINEAVNRFLKKSKAGNPPLDALNPFDPEQISVEAVFSYLDAQPRPDDRVYGFFYKAYETIPTGDIYDYWKEVDTKWNWRVRFSPDIPGHWKVQIKVVTPHWVEMAEPLFFVCRESAGKGYLEVDREHPRFLRYKQSQTPFFATGMNIAFPWYVKGGSGSDPKEFNIHRDNLEKFADTKANFVRLIICPKTYHYEWEELNNYDAPFVLKNNHPPAIERVGRLALAWELDKTIETLEQNDLYYLMCFEFHFPFMDFHPYFPNDPYKWPGNPYKTLEGVTEVDDFFKNSMARKAYKNKLRYYFARWGYSTRMAAFEFFNEMQFLGGKIVDKQKVYPYDHDDEFVQKMEAWHLDMIRYLKDELKVKQLLTSSYNMPPRAIDRLNDHLDIISMHRYGNKQSLNAIHRHNETTHYMARWEKPFIIGECGLVDDAIDVYHCMPEPFIHDIWATAMMGSFGNGLHWWWTQILGAHHEKYFDYLSAFMDEVDFKSFYFTGKSAGFDQAADPRIEYLALSDENGQCMIGWVHNYQAYWKNLYSYYDSCLISQNAQSVFDNPVIPPKVGCKKLTFANKNLQPGKYSLKWYNTLTGQWIKTCKKAVCRQAGEIILKTPVLGNDPGQPQVSSNYAFILEKMD